MTVHWRTRRAFTTVVACAVACGVGLAAQTPVRSWQVGHVLFIPVGQTADLEALYKEARRVLPSPSSDQPGAREDLIVIYTDAEGRPLQPDRDRMLATGSAATTANELTFTFNSPANPWTPGEQLALSSALGDFYPTARSIVGPPAFAITVNIRKDPTINYVGLYYASTNEIVLQSASDLDVLCHEMIHAFHDDDVIDLDTYEEGMARAVEIETFNRLPAYTHWDDAHSYTYDVYYDALNQPAIAPSYGKFNDGFIGAVLLRYQLAGYAWAKALIENPQFFRDFNASYYGRMLADPSVASSESALTAIAASVQPSVEGRSFTAWYGRQHIFDAVAPSGPVVYQRINQFTIDFANRIRGGGVTPIGGAPAFWAAYDAHGSALDWGTGQTVPNGFLDFSLDVSLGGYSGALWVLAAAQAPTGQVVYNISLRTAGPTAGVFGATVADTQGTLAIVSLDDPSVFAIVPVINGAFTAPALATARGRFLAYFQRPTGGFSLRLFTKDASPYFILM